MRTTTSPCHLLNNPFLSGILLLLGLFWTGCAKVYYDKSQSIDPKGWAYADVVEFQFEIKDTTQRYTVVLEVTHANEYAFQNAYCLLRVEFPDTTKTPVRSSQISMEFSNAEGEWYGTKSGSAYTTPLKFIENARFEQLGTYKIRLQQNSRQAVLEHIQALRLRVLPYLPES
jgi:gliding motility-associated lipoprotein GldH